MIKVIVFDLDDTLFPEREFVRSGFQAVGDWMANKYAASDFFEVAWKLFQEGKRGQIFNLTLEKLGVEYEMTMIQQLLQIYRDHQPNISLHHDAQWAIDYCYNYKQLGIITDGYLKTQQNKVKALGIAAKFDAIIYTDAYGRDSWKPSPVSYQKLMELTKCPGRECVYIGDNPAKDFVTAKKLDWLTIQIYRECGEYCQSLPEKSYQADFTIKSLLEIKNYF